MKWHLKIIKWDGGDGPGWGAGVLVHIPYAQSGLGVVFERPCIIWVWLLWSAQCGFPGCLGFLTSLAGLSWGSLFPTTQIFLKVKGSTSLKTKINECTCLWQPVVGVATGKNWQWNWCDTYLCTVGYISAMQKSKVSTHTHLFILHLGKKQPVPHFKDILKLGNSTSWGSEGRPVWDVAWEMTVSWWNNWELSREVTNPESGPHVLGP